jgi:cell division protein FtsL
MEILTDFEKLLLILVISLAFMFIILIIFHFWRIMRKDKLISKRNSLILANKYNTSQFDEHEDDRATHNMFKMSDFKTRNFMSNSTI